VDDKPAQAICIFQQPGSNAVATSHRVLSIMEELAKTFPKGLPSPDSAEKA
jgi:hydrophobic/amphiphilic exporter-1 (mainly G- bacteria), HAE1 family